MTANAVYINGSVGLSHLGLTTSLSGNDFIEKTPTNLDRPKVLYRSMLSHVNAEQQSLNSITEQLSLVIDELIKKHKLSPKKLESMTLFIGSSSLDIGSVSVDAKCNIWLTAIDTISKALVEKYNFKPMGFTMSTACTASANALIYASQMIQQNTINEALVIGCEFVNQLTLQGFESLELISKTSQRSLSEDRDGLILGEGIGALWLSKNQTQDCLLQVMGGATSCDTYSLTTTQEDGSHIQQVIHQSLKSANCCIEDIDLIKVHATGSYANDACEVAALKSVFKFNMPLIMALKPYIGHTLGACGSLEIALLDQLCRADFIPRATYTNTTKTLLPFAASNQSFSSINYILVNHFGFGGNNATVVLKNIGASNV